MIAGKFVRVMDDRPTSNNHRAGPGLRNHKRIEVTWGDCDASSVVHYPRYYEWFDACTHAMLDHVGLDHHALRREHGITGCALVRASAQFFSPATFGDELRAASWVARVGERSFTVMHRLSVGSRVVVEGEEVRVWAQASPDHSLELRAVAIPAEVRALFAQA